MERKTEELLLFTLQNLLIFQMASAGISQDEIRKAVGVDNNRVSRIARLAKKIRKADGD
jgi:hypothetical protein